MNNPGYKPLADHLPREFLQHKKGAAYSLKDVLVIAEHDARDIAWPGSHKNVNVWFELVNGKAVGWNENPNRGWSFPVISLRRS